MYLCDIIILKNVRRCVLAVRREWKSVGDCLQFFLKDFKDDQAAKLVLVQKAAELTALSS
jgi:hypothetical protein